MLFRSGPLSLWAGQQAVHDPFLPRTFLSRWINFSTELTLPPNKTGSTFVQDARGDVLLPWVRGSYHPPPRNRARGRIFVLPAALVDESQRRRFEPGQPRFGGLQTVDASNDFVGYSVEVVPTPLCECSGPSHLAF